MLLGFGLQAPQPVSAAVSKAVEPAGLSVPFSTGSAEARNVLQQGVVKWENHRMGEAVEDYRKAIKADPNFAAAHLFLSTLTPNRKSRAPRWEGCRIAQCGRPG
jgi:hypothetical protein